MRKIALPDVFRPTSDEDYLKGAIETANWIRNHEINDENGRHWAVNCQEGKSPDEVEQTYLSNRTLYSGAAGIGFFFVQLYEVTGEKQYLDEAKEGLEFLIRTYEPSLSIKPGLHTGTAGEGFLALVLHDKTGEKEYLDGYRRFNQALINAGVPEKRSRGYWNHCICCGTSGFLLHFLTEPELIPGQVNVSLAARTANTILHDAYVDDHGRRWYDAWTRVKPWDVDSNLGLFVGDAGNASALLSLYAKNKGIRITSLPEFEV